jgi:hypothetical protein
VHGSPLPPSIFPFDFTRSLEHFETLGTVSTSNDWREGMMGRGKRVLFCPGPGYGIHH